MLLLLILRYNGEEIIRNKQSKGEYWITNINKKEEIDYRRVLLYAYFLGCIKTPKFNPDSVFSVKLVCSIHQRRLQKKSFWCLSMSLLNWWRNYNSTNGK